MSPEQTKRTVGVCVGASPPAPAATSGLLKFIVLPKTKNFREDNIVILWLFEGLLVIEGHAGTADFASRQLD
tara:strand:+ start:116 stop:331 length:216 start_codon:yes stop_codon:yes gene_type:complete